ncbi:MAG: hypothetical protein JRN15_19085, partial [Nitrososphaerota archaeon]|nr:hypothetical protein [Nitrososphaerota archaeon]
ATLSLVLANPPVSIDRSLFLSSVPSYPEIGVNTTVKVLVNNNADEPIPVFLRVEVPVAVMTVHPNYVEALISPGGQVTANFTIVAFRSSSKGMINVTAVLYIWYYHQMNRPQLVQHVSAIVYGLRPYQYARLLLAASLALLIIVPTSLVVLSHRRTKKRRSKTESGSFITMG